MAGCGVALPPEVRAGTETRHTSKTAWPGGLGLPGIEVLDQIRIDLEERDDPAGRAYHGLLVPGAFGIVLAPSKATSWAGLVI